MSQPRRRSGRSRKGRTADGTASSGDAHQGDTANDGGSSGDVRQGGSANDGGRPGNARKGGTGRAGNSRKANNARKRGAANDAGKAGKGRRAGGTRSRRNDRSRRNERSARKGRPSVDSFWRDTDQPRTATRIRPTTDPGALPRSLGEPPLASGTAAAHHLAAVYEEAVRTATALAAANGLLEDGEPAEDSGAPGSSPASGATM